MGRWLAWIIVAALAVAGIALAQTSAPPTRVALVIANSAYQNSTQLNNPRNDAALIEPALRRAGFTDITVVYDQGIGQMRQVLRGFQDRARGADVALVYYAGHSLEAGGENWLIPTDALVRTDQDLEFEAINLNRIVLPAVAGATMRLVLLDACRDNPLGDRMTRSLTTRTSAPSGALAAASADGVLILFATEPGRTATDGARGASSPFAQAVARWLPDPDTPVQNFGFRVRDDVKAATRESRRPQVPFVSASITGELFYLAGRRAPPALAPDPEAEALRRENAELQKRLAEAQKAQPAPVLARPDVPNGAGAPPSPQASLDARTTPASTRAPLVSNPAGLPDFALFRECDGCPEMVVIPAGTFTMGSPSSEAGRDSDEGPQRNVSVRRFAISRFETTLDEWGACVSAGGCQQREDSSFGRGQRPAISVDWNDAAAFAFFVNGRIGAAAPSPRTNGGGGAAAPKYRLPTESEWEYATRAGTSTLWSFGDTESQLGAYAWFDSNSGSRTQPVGGKAPNPWGLFDMHGNVLEWVEDCYANSLANTPTNGVANATGGCVDRVVRGGSWVLSAQNLRSASRSGLAPSVRIVSMGFRLARTL